MNAISCPDSSDCTVVGFFYEGTAFSLTESDGTWGQIQDFSGLDESLDGVSCSDATDCTAVGGYLGDPLYATESNGQWGPETAIAGLTGNLESVSCGAPTDCTAVGGNQNDGILATETDGVWAVGSPIALPSLLAAFTDVSCSDQLNCIALPRESDEDGTAVGPMYARESNGVWSLGFIPWGSGAPSGGGLSSVSCTAPHDCVVVGTDPFTDEPMDDSLSHF